MHGGIGMTDEHDIGLYMKRDRLLNELFGEDTVVTSTKSMTGHLLGAAGAIEAIATVLAVHHDLVPPTINLEDPDDELRVDVPREVRKMSVPVAINDSFGFGGHNASLVFCKA